MSDEGWIKFENEMPTLRKTIEILYEEKVLEACFESYDLNSFAFYASDEENQSFIPDMKYVKGWRHIKEKLPDFGKLNIEDKIIINIISNDSKVSKVIEYFGYFQGISEANMLNISLSTYDFINDCISVSKIKKITRINLQEKTFEEI